MKLTTLKLNNGYYVLRAGRYNVLKRKDTYNTCLFERRISALNTAKHIENYFKVKKELPNEFVIVNI